MWKTQNPLWKDYSRELIYDAVLVKNAEELKELIEELEEEGIFWQRTKGNTQEEKKKNNKEITKTVIGHIYSHLKVSKVCVHIPGPLNTLSWCSYDYHMSMYKGFPPTVYSAKKKANKNRIKSTPLPIIN